MKKIHLVLRGHALCDFQFAQGGRLATTSVRDFKRCGDDACKECSRRLSKMEVRVRGRPIAFVEPVSHRIASAFPTGSELPKLPATRRRA